MMLLARANPMVGIGDSRQSWKLKFAADEGQAERGHRRGFDVGAALDKAIHRVDQTLLLSCCLFVYGGAT